MGKNKGNLGRGPNLLFQNGKGIIVIEADNQTRMESQIERIILERQRKRITGQGIESLRPQIPRNIHTQIARIKAPLPHAVFYMFYILATESALFVIAFYGQRRAVPLEVIEDKHGAFRP